MSYTAPSDNSREQRKHYVLLNDITAIQVNMDEKGRARMGAVLRLPRDAELHLCGPGFSERTVKVAWQGAFYYVFEEDLKRPHSSRTMAATA
jgi:hypothetical protein